MKNLIPILALYIRKLGRMVRWMNNLFDDKELSVVVNNTSTRELDSNCKNDLGKKSEKSHRPSRAKCTLEEFMRGMTPDMQEDETSWGEPVGAEIIDD